MTVAGGAATGPQVEVHEDGSATVTGAVLYGTWTVAEEDGAWLIRNVCGTSVKSHLSQSAPARYSTRSAALAALGVAGEEETR